jgi:hypothetical protein
MEWASILLRDLMEAMDLSLSLLVKLHFYKTPKTIVSKRGIKELKSKDHS